MELFKDWLEQLAALLGRAGIPEPRTMTAALGLVFVLVTLLVVLIIVWLVQRNRPAGRETPPSDAAPAEAVPDAAAKSESEPAREAEPETETVPEPPPVSPAPPVPDRPQRVADEPVAEGLSLVERMRRGLAKTQASLVGRLDSLLSGRSRVDAELLEELEEILITADIGMKTTRELMQAIDQRLSREAAGRPELVRDILRQEMTARLAVEQPLLEIGSGGPRVVMVVGVNGVGKTTTIGKLAKTFTDQGHKVILGAGDTFRAAAAEQLEEWGRRTGVEVIRHQSGADPGAVAFDAARAAVARKADILLLDTAGRLHTKVNLMEELKKIQRVLAREISGAPHETLLVLDATTGQNALVQARLFGEAVDVSGVILTKLDGTARGGIVLAIAAELQLPVRYIGVGEKVDDLRPFDADEFVAALFETGEKS